MWKLCCQVLASIAVSWSASAQTCKRISVKPQGETEWQKNLLLAFQKKDAKALTNFFHPRLKMKSGKIEAVLLSLQEMAGKDLEWSFVEAFDLQSSDGSSKPIDCSHEKDIPLRIHPLFGYKTQKSLWLQALGPKNIFRVHALVVDQEKIGAFEYYQWTIGGENMFDAIATVRTKIAQNELTVAYVRLDLLQKLLRKTGHVEFPDRDILLAEKAKLFSEEAWLKEMQRLFKDSGIAYATTMYTADGFGLLLRKRTEKDISLKDLRDECNAKLKTLSQTNASLWSQISGVRCGYNLPKESLDKEGAIGSFFATRS